MNTNVDVRLMNEIKIAFIAAIFVLCNKPYGISIAERLIFEELRFRKVNTISMLNTNGQASLISKEVNCIMLISLI